MGRGRKILSMNRRGVEEGDERKQGVNEERNKMLFIELDWKVNVFSLNQSNLLVNQSKKDESI